MLRTVVSTPSGGRHDQDLTGAGRQLCRSRQSTRPEDWEHILEFRRAQTTAWSRIWFKQKKRLADATRSLQSKGNQESARDVRIATDKIEGYLERLSDVKRTESRPNDGRIFPMTFAPVIINDGGQEGYPSYALHLPSCGEARVVRPQISPGTYNARRDNLEGFWSSSVWRHTIAVVWVDSFFENVPTHRFEKAGRSPKASKKPTPACTFSPIHPNR